MNCNSDRFEDELFTEAAALWNLEKLYGDLAAKKITSTERIIQLTPVKKAILRGLLCGYPPKKIAAALHWAPGTLGVELTKGLYRYVEMLTDREANSLKNWRDIARWLETAGYKTPKCRHDWGDAPDNFTFYGRTTELNTLKQWIGTQRYRLVTLLGMGGIGKTTLAAKLAQEMKGEFDCIIWRSLRHAPSLNQLLVNLIQFLSNQPPCHCQDDTKVLIYRAIECLRQRRCLIILDDAQTLMQSCTLAGQYRQNYEDYTELLTEVGRERHQSCLVLNSWEKPLQIELLERETSGVASLKLTGLPPEEAKEILAANNLFREDEAWEELIQLYRGNPLALNTAIAPIADFFNSSVADFLKWKSVIVTELLQAKVIELLNRLDASEREIIRYLARNRTPVLREQLRHDLHFGSDSRLINTLKSLERRSILEKVAQRNQTFFTLSPVVMTVTREHYNLELPCSAAKVLSATPRYLVTNRLSVS